MSNLEKIVNVTITTDSRGVSQKSFGIPLVLGYTEAFTELYRVYSLGSAAEDLVADGIPAGSPIYKAVTALASNTPKATTVVVGRLTTKPSQQGTLSVKAGSVIPDKVFSIEVQEPSGGTVHTLSYTAQSGDTGTDVATAMAALIDALTGITASSAAEVISWAADTDGDIWTITGYNADFNYMDLTPDSNLAADLTAINTEYSDWYGLLLAECPSTARNKALAAAVEAKEAIFAALTHDADNLDASSVTSLGAELKAAGYFRTFSIYSGDTAANAAATWLGNRLPIDPGSSTWAYKPLAGVKVDTLTGSETAALEGNNVNYYVEIAGANVTIDGKMAAGEWIDVIRFRDWLTARIRERVFSVLINSPKVPYTDAGVAVITAQVKAQLQEGINKGGLSADPEPVVTAPRVSEIDKADKVARLLPDVYFEATLAGAIHTIKIIGVLKA